MPLNILQGADEVLIDLETQAHPDPSAFFGERFNHQLNGSYHSLRHRFLSYNYGRIQTIKAFEELGGMSNGRRPVVVVCETKTGSRLLAE